MIYLDTNILVRFFTHDDLTKATKVKDLLEKESEIFISDVVFPEIEYVLIKIYNLKRNSIVSVFKFLLAQKAINYSKIIPEATNLYENSNLDMADCIIASESMNGKLASFDEELLKTQGIKKYW